MSDLISKDNLSKYKEKLGYNEPIEVDAYYSGWNDAIDCIIKNEPSVEPERIGKWMKKPDPYGFFDGIPVCSECGCIAKYQEEYKYCPNCGVLMAVTE